MSLVSKAGQLVRRAGQLAASCVCCNRYWCVPSYTDACGQQRYTCTSPTGNPPNGSQGPYASPQCEGQSCAPINPCLKWWCYITGYSPCSKTLYRCVQDSSGAGAIAGPYDTGCPSCVSDYTCSGGNWYCCYDQDQTTTIGQLQKAAPHCQSSPCTGMSTGNYGYYSSGPHGSQAACYASCQKHACSNNACAPDSTGQYDSQKACEDVCIGCGSTSGSINADPNRPPSFSTVFGQGNISVIQEPTVRSTPPVALVSRKFLVGASAGRVAVTMSVSLAPGYSRLGTIRWQILGSGFDGAGRQVASRVMKADSGWRVGCLDGHYPCDPSPDAHCRDGINGVTITGPIQDPADFVDASGRQYYDVIYWCKPEGVTCFEVAVLSPCESVDWLYQVIYTPGPCNISNLPGANPAP
jgi:hypothetical protein